ncbi:7494_t:CDS:2 [Entrophospora sp. SA101]|nr:8934_t:CDS:2 [Entrophospora sp. SA101]CAJ0832938.1 7494_t:CDS:2 [Entrophospora sp. SA101]
MSDTIKKRKPSDHHHEREKCEKSKNEIKSLIARFGTNKKVDEELEEEATMMRNKIKAFVKRHHYTYLYVEPYEPVVHGTYGVDQTTSWRIVWSITNSIRDFFAEVMNGGRGFGSPSYDGFVPI